METKNKQGTKSKVYMPVNIKRDYYFHADEDFREDREWGKTNTAQIKTEGADTSRSLSA